MPDAGIRASPCAFRRFIFAMIWPESVMMYSLGALRGICVIGMMGSIIVTEIPSLQIFLDNGDRICGMVLGLLSRNMVAIYPAYKGAQTGSCKGVKL